MVTTMPGQMLAASTEVLAGAYSMEVDTDAGQVRLAVGGKSRVLHGSVSCALLPRLDVHDLSPPQRLVQLCPPVDRWAGSLLVRWQCGRGEAVPPMHVVFAKLVRAFESVDD